MNFQRFQGDAALQGAKSNKKSKNPDRVVKSMVITRGKQILDSLRKDLLGLGYSNINSARISRETNYAPLRQFLNNKGNMTVQQFVSCLSNFLPFNEGDGM